MHPLRHLLQGALDLAFAPICVACRGPIPSRSAERSVCAACWSRARELPLPRCARCWLPHRISFHGVEPTCPACGGIRPAVRFVRAAYLLEGPTRGIVHALKYRGWYSLAQPMARRMASLDLPTELERDGPIVTPVPLAAVKWRQRGYNQASLLAAECARIRRWRSEESALERTRSAGSQTTLHPGERRANVAGAFRVPASTRSRITAEHVLLVDDVWTTGATALACADALLDAGARAVSVLTFARALPELERHERRLEKAAIP
jgi:ComF family protein